MKCSRFVKMRYSIPKRVVIVDEDPFIRAYTLLRERRGKQLFIILFCTHRAIYEVMTL